MAKSRRRIGRRRPLPADYAGLCRTCAYAHSDGPGKSLVYPATYCERFARQEAGTTIACSDYEQEAPQYEYDFAPVTD